MIKEIKTKEEKQNKRVTKIIAALFVAGVIILIAAYVPDVFKKNKSDDFAPPDLTEETTRLFTGEIESIDYEKKLFTLALYDPNLYEGYKESELATGDEFSMSPWIIIPFFFDGTAVLDEGGEEVLSPEEDTEIAKITVELRESEPPLARFEALSFDDLKAGDYVQVSFWSYGYSSLTRSITPYSVIVAENPFTTSE